MAYAKDMQMTITYNVVQMTFVCRFNNQVMQKMQMVQQSDANEIHN